MEWIYYLVMMVVSVVGLALAIIGLPGIWLIVAAVGVYAYLTGGAYIGIWGLVLLIGLGVVAEILETVLGGVAAGRAGGSKRGMAGAVVGGIIGAIAGTPLIPIPLIGTIVGACVGSFLGAFGVEVLWLKRSTKDSLKVGTGAAAGKFAGMMTKLLFGGLMLVIAGIWSLPIWGPAGTAIAPAGPATLPAILSTQPATDSIVSPPSEPATLPSTQPG